MATTVGAITKAHSKGDCTPDKKKDQLAKDYTVFIQSCLDITVRQIADYVGTKENLTKFVKAAPELLTQVNKNFFMLDKLIVDLTKFEENKSCDNLTNHMSVN